MTDAVFTRNETADGVVFEVTPATQSAAYTFQWVAVATVVFFLIFGIYLSIRGASFLLILAAIGLAALCILPIRRDLAKRKPVTLVAGKGDLRVNEQSYPLSNLAEMYLKQPEMEDRIVANNGMSVAGAQVGMAVEKRHKRRCLSLVVRMKDVSKPIEIVFGLTPEAGLALMNDLGHVLGLSKA